MSGVAQGEYEVVYAAIADGDSTNARRLLASLLPRCNTATLRGIWHPTGFVVIQLPWQSAKHAIRLHFWPAQHRLTSVPCWPIHDHVWSFTSLVVDGSVTNRVYTLADDTPAPYAVYEVTYVDNQRSQLDKLASRVRVSTQRATFHSRGSCYRLLARQFHTTEVRESSQATTVIATERQLQQKPRVLGDTHGPATLSVCRQPLPDSETYELLAGLLLNLRS
jgi:hypothetical protein